MEGFIMERKFLLYTWSSCPYCKSAKELLDSKGYKYEEQSLDNDDAMRQKLISSTGQNVTPYIYLNDHFLGNFDDLILLEEEGKL